MITFTVMEFFGKGRVFVFSWLEGLYGGSGDEFVNDELI